jgi:transcriptional regulator with XRE-family HTH domain
MKEPRNIVGPQVRELRIKQGLTQPLLVAKLNLLGWEISRETLAKLETQIRWVSDSELLLLSKALEVPLDDLYPPNANANRSARFL